MSNALPLDGSHLDIVTLIETDHRATAALMAELEAAKPGRRRELFVKLVPFLVAHEMAEEQVVYPAIHTVTNAADPMIEARLTEQQEAERLLRTLEDLDPASDGFVARFAELREAVTAHAAAEESEVLPLLAELEQALDRPGMGARYQEAKRRAPEHPHPEAPQRPPGNLVAGPLTGLVDRIRDALR